MQVRTAASATRLCRRPLSITTASLNTTSAHSTSHSSLLFTTTYSAARMVNVVDLAGNINRRCRDSFVAAQCLTGATAQTESLVRARDLVPSDVCSQLRTLG